MPAPLRSLPPNKKRRKVAHDTSSTVISEIQVLEAELSEAIRSNASLNKLADLVDLVVPPTGKKKHQKLQSQELSKGIYALYRTFTLVISSGKLSSAGGEGDAAVVEAAKAVKAWLWERLHRYTDFLVLLMKDEEKVLRTSALQILFSLQKHLSSASQGARPEFHVAHFRKIVNGLLLCPSASEGENNDGLIDADVLNMFYETWFSVYDDIRWFFLRESMNILEKVPPSQTSPAKNLLSILERLTTFPTDQSELDAWWVPELGVKPPKPKPSKSSPNNDSDESDSDDVKMNEDGQDEQDDWRKFFEDEPPESGGTKKKPTTARLHKMTIHQSLHSLSSHKAVFTRAWLALLPRLSAAPSTDAEKSGGGGRKALAMRALNVMHRGVLPHLTRPILVMDWIAGCVDLGGSLGLLALNGLFTLMKDYNLDYPSFYTRLYAFLDRDVLHLKHRARFFRMTELFLSSSHLPSTLLASFIKRLSRLSLSAPPAAIVMIVPFTYNVLKRHPALMVMIHRDAEPGFQDPFDGSEPNPLSTGALESSLWELYSHRTHYHATVSTLCKVFSEAFTKPGYAMEDFLDHTYATLFETEVQRKIKKEPALAMEEGKVDLFPSQKPEQDEEQVVQGDIVNELWVF